MTAIVVAAVRADLVRLGERDEALAGSALAASALVLASALDNRRNSATSKAMCTRELREVMDRLWALAPAEEKADAVNDLAAQRRKRIAERARRAAASHSPHS